MELLYALLVILVTTRIAAEIAVRWGQAALVGELVAGVLLGILARQFSATFPVLAGLPEDAVFQAITDLGIFFLMLLGGVELQPGKLAEGTKAAVLVAFGGMALPLAMGTFLGIAILPDSQAKAAQTLFLGVALAVTAIPVAVKALMDLGKLNTKAGQVIVSAAIIDDVLSLVLLAALTAMIRTGDLPGLAALGVMAVELVAFFAISAVLGLYVVPRISHRLKKASTAEFEFSALVIFALGEAMLAEALGLHFILGAFVAGLFFSRHTPDAETFENVKSKVSGITTGFLAPVFFASIGFSLTFSPLTESPGFLTLILVVAILGKLIGSGLPAFWAGLGKRNAAAIGVGMVGRGAVELVIADIALRAGLFDVPDPAPPAVAALFPSVVLMAILTTLLAPIGLRILWRNDADGAKQDETATATREDAAA